MGNIAELRRFGLWVLLVGAVAGEPAASAQWRTTNPGTEAPIRFVARSGARLIGGRVGERPNVVETLVSTDDGATWTRNATVATAPPRVVCGDVCVASDGGSLVYCAFRQQLGPRWEVTACRSSDGGSTWTFDGVVAASANGQFVGAPCLFFARDGNLRCFYDSEPAATAAGHPGQSYVAVVSKGRLAFGAPWGPAAVACRPADERTLSRHGMASVVNLEASEVILVCEGVDPANPARNCLYAVFSHDDGRTWDLATRQVICRPVVGGVQFNAYCPQAIRVGGGPVGVVYCTDDDFPIPSLDSAPVNRRNAHVKYIRTLATFQAWSRPELVDGTDRVMYAPGLFEVANNSLTAIIDHAGARQVIKQR